MVGGDVADAQARREHLRERADVDHAAVRIHAAERRQRIALEAQRRVGVVLDHEHVVADGELEHGRPPLERERRAARVLERRDHVDQLGRPALALAALERVGEPGGVDAVAVDRARG